MPNTVPVPVDRRLGALAAGEPDDMLAFGSADLLALPVLLLLCLAFFCVGVWDTLHEKLLQLHGN